MYYFIFLYIENHLYNNLTLQYIEEHINFSWSFDTLSNSKIINFDFIEKHIDKKWNYETLLRNPDLILIFIFNYFDNMWDFNVLSETNILSFDFIKACSEYNFILRNIFDNKMIDEKELFIRDCYRTHFMKAYSIF